MSLKRKVCGGKEEEENLMENLLSLKTWSDEICEIVINEKTTVSILATAL